MLDAVLFIPDTHRPYHHVKAYGLMIKVAQSLGKSLKEIVILGDYADFYCINSHGKDPRIGNLLTEEVVNVLEGLSELDELFPDANKVFIEGNHEYRLERYLLKNAPALFGVTGTEHILQLSSRPKWKFIPYGPNQSYHALGSYLVARHEPLGSTAKASATKAMCSFIHGHTHRIETAYTVSLMGSQHICYSPGWLGDKRKDIIYGYVKHHHQWNMGFSIAYVNRKTGEFYPQIIQIIEGDDGRVSCSFNGELFE